jgi:hypothetical protein
MARTQDVPGPDERGRETGAPDQLLALLPHRDVAAHDGRGLRHAQIDEMADAGQQRGRHGGLDGGKVHRAELRRFRGTGARRADQVHQGVGRPDRPDERAGVEGVAAHHLHATLEPGPRSHPYQGLHGVPSPQQLRQQPLGDVAGGAG